MADKKSKHTMVKKPPKTLLPVSLEGVQSKIVVLHGEPMILDRDVAKLYGVQTKDINRAVSNNPDKFPEGYTYALNNQEVADMRLKILTTSSEDADSEQVNVKFSKSHYNPTAFTEKGLYMMATILKFLHRKTEAHGKTNEERREMNNKKNQRASRKRR